jgi:hypothetical protein
MRVETGRRSGRGILNDPALPSKFQGHVFMRSASAHPQMALLRDFSVGRRDLNPQNSALFLRFKSDARLEITQNPSFVGGH